jgi:hypothetical protein
MLHVSASTWQDAPVVAHGKRQKCCILVCEFCDPIQMAQPRRLVTCMQVACSAAELSSDTADALRMSAAVQLAANTLPPPPPASTTTSSLAEVPSLALPLALPGIAAVFGALAVALP